MDTLPIKVIVLSSGSKGNLTYIEIGPTKILIDMGTSAKYVTDRLKEININPNDIDAILITHTHKDHTAGLLNYLKRHNNKVYLTEKMHKDLSFIENYKYLGKENIIGVSTVKIIKTSHDASDSVGYVITNNNRKIVYITDTGYINQKYDDILSNADIYIMESNHDIEMLQHSSYPFILRQRILSDKGHLSNIDASRYLAKYIGSNTKYIFLAHLSEENNTENLALTTLQNKLKEEQIPLPNIIIAKQNIKTDSITI